jgi:molybdopterin converting factor small subunit
MPRVELTPHLRRYFPALGETTEVEGATVAEVVAALEERHPGLAGYLLDDRGALRKHVNIFVGDRRVRDRERLRDEVAADARVFILQALSGG